MNPGNIAALAAGAGFTGNDVDIATAVALGESDGNPQAYNPEGSYGLWQIYLPDHPEFANWNLYDPQTNARAAYQVYAKAGGRFTPWSAYKNGSFRQFLPTFSNSGFVSTNPEPRPAGPPLTIDAATGQPIPDVVAAGFSPPSGGPSFGTVILWGVIGFFALWIFEEAM
jgi:Lysozyme like domain